MTTVPCSNCSTNFDVKPYRLARNKSGRIYCSLACRTADGAAWLAPQKQLPDLVCPICGSTFYRKAVERLPINYCSYRCAAIGTGNLKPPAVGERRSQRTEFAVGSRPTNVLPVGSITIRKRPRRNDSRAWVKVAEPNVWKPRAIVEWEMANGPIEHGMVVHHINRDPLDDRPENLMALTRSAHLAEHRSDR